MRQLRSYAKLRAIHEQKLMPIATKAQNSILEHAMILIGVSLRGYPSTIQAFRLAQYNNTKNSIHAECIDPRKNQEHVLDMLEESLVQYMNRCKKMGSAPQIWIPNRSALRMWEALCDRLSYTQKHAPLCSILQFTTQRQYYAGSQTFLAISHVLKQHFVTGQPDTEDEALETWVQWFHNAPVPPINHCYTFLPESLETNNPIREDIIPVLEAETHRRLLLAQQTLHLFSQYGPPLISSFVDWWQQDLQYFQAFCAHPNTTQPDPLPLAAQKFEEREFTQDNYLADLRREDAAFFYGALLEGHCLEGIVHQIQGQNIHILCNQPIIRAREGDSLVNRTHPSDQYRIIDSKWTEEGYLVLLKKHFGKISCSLHSKIQLTPHAMGWKFQHQRRKNLSHRIQQTGWIHKEEPS